MNSDWRMQAFESILAMTGKTGSPLNLVTHALPFANPGDSISAEHLAGCISDAPTNSSFLTTLGMQVHKWDAAEDNLAWAAGTARSTRERRALICSLLGINEVGAEALVKKRPIFHDTSIVITAPWNRWYTAERAHLHTFYWPHYRDYLLNIKGWPAESVTSLDLTATGVVERLTDPTRAEAYQAKGLVVGYVQSGKTANFTGVIAKAIDAGYRLVIVMTGTIEMLRSQTQRRLDMEMVGRKNITGDLTPEEAAAHKTIDYQDDEAWIAGKFADLGEPTDLRTEIVRLTQHKKDYQKQFKTLKIDRADPAKPLYDADNLFKANARLAIVKKNAAVLKKLVNDIEANRNAFTQIPVLIIDDESDQASVNTVDPEQVQAARREGTEIKERRVINERIARMLELMPRAQYVGYTATPFANVFVDPSDEQGIFPKDFLIGLPRPPYYMGVDDFHDLGDSMTDEDTEATSNAKAFVRDLDATEEDEAGQDRELARAIDMFVLTGAVKVYRGAIQKELDFRHHTMLVHSSVSKEAHGDLADRVRMAWKAAEFTRPSGKSRLRDLYDNDLLPVSAARLEAGIPPLPPFEAIADSIGEAIWRVTVSQDNPVLVVNSDKDIQAQQQALDFDRHATWRILVGGAKLSRGFTVEGLTVTYFRRATNMSDSLTQMGRWFGFRPGYRDLIRLYIARHAKFGSKPVDIYKAFEGVAQDEAAFRKQLQQYAEWDGDKPRVLPSQIPPLVEQHLPWLRPTARNKMFNAVIVEQSEQPFTPAGYANSVDDLKVNLDIWRPILALASESVALSQGKWSGFYTAFVGLVSAETVVEAMESSRYLPYYRDRSIKPKTTFYRRLMRDGMLKDFLVVVPQPDTPSTTIGGVGSRRIISRDRRTDRGGKFGEITEPKHKPALEEFVGPRLPVSSVLARWQGEGRGAALLYLAKETEPSFDDTPRPGITKDDPEYGIVAAYSAYVPSAALAKDPAVIQFKVRDENRPAASVVDAPRALA